MAITGKLAIQYDGMTSAFFAILFGYLLGSVLVADLVTRRVGAPNLRDVGDRNPGFWNSRSVLSRNQTLVIFFGDILKGSLAVLHAKHVSEDWRVWFLAAGAAVIGHAWPVFGMFSGGRSVLTWIGTAIVLSPWAAVFSILMFLLFLAATRAFSHAVRIAVIVYPFAQWYSNGAWQAASTFALMMIIGIRFVRANGFASTIRAATPVVRVRRRPPRNRQPSE